MRFVKERYIVTEHDSIVLKSYKRKYRISTQRAFLWSPGLNPRDFLSATYKDGILGKLGRIDPSSRGCNEAGNTYDDPKRYPPLATIPLLMGKHRCDVILDPS